jgi:hypothetical protein
MSWYTFFKFLHVLAAIIAVGTNVTYFVWLRQVPEHPEHELFILRGIRQLDSRLANPAYYALLVLGIVLVLIAFGARVVAGYRIALRARDLHGQVLAVGVITLVAAQAIVNVGAVLGFLPVTGVPHPFVSFGGSSLIVLLFAAGTLVNIGRRPSRGSSRLRLVGGGDETGSGGDRRGRDGRPRDARAGGGGRALGARG